jgi:hypothetical protein
VSPLISRSTFQRHLHPADVYYGRAEAIFEQRKPLKERTRKARRKANLTNANNPRKKGHLRARILP